MTRHFLFVLVGRFTHLAFSNALEPLRIANRESGETLYTWSFMSADGKTATSSNDVTMLVDYDMSDLPPCDRVMVVSGNDVQDEITKPLLSLLRRARAAGKPIGTFCSGAFIFAAAGFLTDRRAAMHWEFHPGFTEKYPDVQLEQGVFVRDGQFMTSSGGNAAADMILSLIEEDHGPALARKVSDQMVYTTVRTGADKQRVSIRSMAGIKSPKLLAAVAMMEEEVEDILTIEDVAEAVDLSVRQLERLFTKYLKTSPRKYLTELRINRAKTLLIQTDMPLADIAVACGFANAASLGRAYKRQMGIFPTQQRSRFAAH